MPSGGPSGDNCLVHSPDQIHPAARPRRPLRQGRDRLCRLARAVSRNRGLPDTSQALQEVFAGNPNMRVFLASGYYDFATPYFATEYTLGHMGLDPVERQRISTAEYEAGHVMYIDEGELAQLKADVAAFLDAALRTTSGP